MVRRDQVPVFEVCDPCPGHVFPEGTRVTAGLALAEYVADDAARAAVQVRLSREWLHEHGPRPGVMVFHVVGAPATPGFADRVKVTLSAVPEWAQ